MTLSATVSGSFTRHIDEIQRAVTELKARGVKVLSPEQPTIVDSVDGFLFVASDRHRSVRLVQDRHLASIAGSDFLWLENPDGHVGQSAALELGFAIASGIPIFTTALPDDLTMRQYVAVVPDIQSAIMRAAKLFHAKDDIQSASLLVDPIAATETAAKAVESLGRLLTKSNSRNSGSGLNAAVRKEQARIAHALDL